MKLTVKIIRASLFCSIFPFKQTPLHSMVKLSTDLGGLQKSMNTLKGELQKFSGSLGALQKKLSGKTETEINGYVLFGDRGTDNHF